MSSIVSLASFDGSDGNDPYGSLITDASGNLYGTTEAGGTSNGGTVFEVTASQTGYNSTPVTLVSFGGGAYSGPQGGLIADASGNLYGTTFGGGTAGDGTVFEVTYTGTGATGFGSTPTLLAQFSGNQPGGNGPASPNGSLIADSSGNLYGTSENGGPDGDGDVFEIAKSGSSYNSTPVQLAAFGASSGGYETVGSLVDISGDLFGTTQNGGTYSQSGGTIFEVVPGNSKPTTLASFDLTDGELANGGLLADASGDLFGTTQGGGPSYDGTVFELAEGSSTPTDLATFDGGDGRNPLGSLIADAEGNLYGTTSSGGAYNDGTVFEIAKTSTGYDATPIVLASFDGGDGADPGGGALVADSSGNLYGTTQSGGANGDGTAFEITNSGFVTGGTMATWTGDVPNNSDYRGNAWENAGNWNPEVIPGTSTSVDIPYTLNFPVLSKATATVASVLIENQQELEILDANLTVNGNFTESGSSTFLEIDSDLTYAPFGGGSVVRINGTLTLDTGSQLLIGDGGIETPTLVTVDAISFPNPTSNSDEGKIVIEGGTASDGGAKATLDVASVGFGSPFQGVLQVGGQQPDAQSVLDFTPAGATGITAIGYLGAVYVIGGSAFVASGNATSSNGGLANLATVDGIFLLDDGASVTTGDVTVGDGLHSATLGVDGSDVNVSTSYGGAALHMGALTLNAFTTFQVGNGENGSATVATASSVDATTNNSEIIVDGSSEASFTLSGQAGFGTKGQLSGDIVLEGKALLDFAGGAITTISDGSLTINGSNAFLAVGTSTAQTTSNSALTSLATVDGGLTLANGASVTTGSATGAAGTLTIGNTLTDAGFITTTNLDIAAGGTLAIATGATVSSAITFAGTASNAATLALGATPKSGSTFANTLTNFGNGDALDLEGLAYVAGATATYSNGTLTVTSNGVSENFTLSTPGATTFYASEDAVGGTVVTTNAPPVLVPATGSVVAGQTVSGNALTGDSDPNGGTLSVTSVSYGGITDPVSATGSTTIAGAYGTLTISSNGAYSYAATNGLGIVTAQDGAPITDTFGDTVTESEGPSAPSSLALTVSLAAGGTETVTNPSGNATYTIGATTLTLNETAASTFGGVIQNGSSGNTGGNVVVTGSAPLTLTGVSTYTGRTSVSGTLALAGTGSVHSSTKVALTASGAAFDISGTTAGEVVNKLGGVAGTVAALGSQNLKIKVQNGTVDTFSGTIQDGGISSGTGASITLGGTGELNLTAAESYIGATTLDAGTLALTGSGSIATSSGLSLLSSLGANSTFDISGEAAASIGTLTGVAGATIALGAGTLTVTEASAGSFAGVIADGGLSSGTGGSLVVGGTAALTLTGIETYTGRTSVSGTLDLSGAGSIHSSTKVALTKAGAMFDISGATGGEVVNKLGGVAGTATALGKQNLKIKVQAGTVDQYSGTIEDGGIAGGTGGSVTLGGQGTLVLGAGSSYTGGTTLDAGTLELAAFDAAGSGTITFANPASNGVATLQIDAAALSSAGPTASAFADAIAGATSANQVIDLRSLAYNQGSTSATVTGGTSLVVSDGPSTVTLTLASSTSKSSFVTASDGHGGTLVYDPPSSTRHAPATAKVDTSWIEMAMADVGGVSGDGHIRVPMHEPFGQAADSPFERHDGHDVKLFRGA